MIVHVTDHCDNGSIPAPWSCAIKVSLVTSEKSDVLIDPTKRHKFWPGTPVFSYSNTGSMSGGSQWTSRENSLTNW